MSQVFRGLSRAGQPFRSGRGKQAGESGRGKRSIAKRDLSSYLRARRKAAHGTVACCEQQQLCHGKDLAFR